MSEMTRDGDAERLEAERLGRLRTTADADRRVRGADQDSRALGMPNDMLSVRDRALRQACAELDALHDAQTEIRRLRDEMRDARAEIERLKAVAEAARKVVSLGITYGEVLPAHTALKEAVAALDAAPDDKPPHDAAAERALIVAWLRMVAEDTFCTDNPEYGAVMDAADCIERDDHAQPAAPAELQDRVGACSDAREDRAYKHGYLQSWREWMACVSRDGRISAENIAALEKRREAIERGARAKGEGAPAERGRDG